MANIGKHVKTAAVSGQIYDSAAFKCVLNVLVTKGCRENGQARLFNIYLYLVEAGCVYRLFIWLKEVFNLFLVKQ